MTESTQPAAILESSSTRRLALLLALVLALLPLALFIYLGSHSRLAADDFCHIVSGQAFGPWGNALFWRNLFNGSFGYYFLQGLAGPLDTAAPSVFVVIIIATGLIGLVWLNSAGHRLTGREMPALAPALILSAALVAFSVSSLLSPLPIYHYSAAARHMLPIVILLIALAACCEVIPRLRSKRRLAVACLFFTMVAFANAGLAETFAILQLALLTSLLPLAYSVLGKQIKRQTFALILSGWTGNVTALLVIVTAPGVAIRTDGNDKLWNWLLSPGRMLTETFEHIQLFFIDAELNAAFIGLLALCLFLLLADQPRRQIQPMQKPFQLAAPPLLFCALAQLLLLPLLWSQQSDYTMKFGSLTFTAVVGIQMLLPLCLAVIILKRHKINAFLLNKSEYWTAIPALTLAVVFVLFSFTQYPNIDWRASIYLFYSINFLLFALLWQIHSHLQTTGTVRFFATFILLILVIWVAVLALVGVQAALGKMKIYSLPFVSFAFALTGFFYGNALAFGINQVNTASPATRPTRAIMYGSALVALAIWISMMRSNAQSIPTFREYSRAWDERHELILAKRDEGERLLELPRLNADDAKLAGYYHNGLGDYWMSWCLSDKIHALIDKRYRAEEY